MDRIQQVLDIFGSLSEAEQSALWVKLERIKATAAGPPPSAKAAVPRQPKTKTKKVACPRCPTCDSPAVKGHGKYRGRRRYKCLACSKTFNDLTSTPLAGIHMPEKLREFAAQMATGGKGLQKSADDLDISAPTAFNWRHRILKGYNVAKARKLKGIAEADETFFHYSEKGSRSVSTHRKPRKRGGKATKAGISDEQVPVIVGCDRQGEMILGTAGLGRISLKDIERVLGDRIEPEATLCTDAHSSFRAFAKANDLAYKAINASKGIRVVKGIYHIQHANNAHTRLKSWMVRFNGVSTKYLDNYAQWFGLMEETKALPNREAEFTERSVPRRRRKSPNILD